MKSSLDNKSVKIDSDDKNIKSGESEIEISCVFDELTAKVIVDENNPTIHGDIEVAKVYKVQKTVSAPSVYIRCLHPTVEGAGDLHSLKLADLKVRAKELAVDGSVEDKRVASLWRSAIWKKFDNLELSDFYLDVGALKKDSKNIYRKLELEMPTFALFKADRERTGVLLLVTTILRLAQAAFPPLPNMMLPKGLGSIRCAC